MNPNFQQSWSPSAVFSPSAARQQLLEAKDWAYIDQWLTTHFHPNPVPPFERNSETLKALLALSSANETADEEVSLKRQVEMKALKELKETHDAIHNSPPTAITLLTDSLPPDGLLALHSLSLLTVALSLPHTTTTNSTPTSTKLATALTNLTLSETTLTQNLTTLTTLHNRLQTHLSRAHTHYVSLTSPPQDPSTFYPHTTPHYLSQKLTEWTHAQRHLQQKSAEYTHRLGVLSKSHNSGVPTNHQLETISIPVLEQAERKIEELKESVLALEGQGKAFQGLPPDKDLARLEVERVEGMWRELEQKKEREYDRLAR